MIRPLAMLALCLVVASTADAVLVDMGTITRDPSQNLDWLDVDQTVGSSFDDIIGDAGGYLTAGWRYATQSEMCGFAIQLGMPEPCPAPASPTFVFDAALGVSIIALIGNTSPAGLPRADGMYEDGSDNGVTGLAQVLPFSRGVQFAVRDDHWTRSGRSDAVGSFLVRAIPEPSTVLLVGAGLSILARRPRVS